MRRHQPLHFTLWEAFIKACGWATSFLVVIIVVFLFSEGLSLFSEKPIEGGYELGVHPSITVEEIGQTTLQRITEGTDTNWAQLGGPNRPLTLLSLNNLEKYLKGKGLIRKKPEELIGADYAGLRPLLDSLLQADPGLLLAFQPDQLPPQARRLPMGNVSAGAFLSGTQWMPAENPVPFFGALPLVWGTLLVTLGALLFALLFGPPVAIFLAELASKRTRSLLKPMIELLAGIPSVVFGFLGLVVLVPWIQSAFGLNSGSTALAGSVLLAIIALPTIISVSEDALRAVPRDLKEASLALGANHWQTIRTVCVPYARPGILAAAILGVGRIVGETMVVLMVTGNKPQMPGFDFLESVRTMSAAIAAEMGEAPQGGLHFKALFMVGGLLFLLTFLINLVGEVFKLRTGLR
jgi:phosphate transport system permease protein